MVLEILETLGVVVSGIATYWSSVGGGLSYLITSDRLSNKSTDEIKSMKSFKDSSLLKKALYVSHPGVYWAMGNEKEKRNRLENEFRKKHGMKTLEEECEDEKQKLMEARTTYG
jgi:hypothetical protein